MENNKQEWWKSTFDDKYLKTYVDAVTDKRTKEEVDFLEKVLKQNKKHKILDVACGHGRHSIELANRGYAMTGLDFSNHFLKIARQKSEEKNLKVNFVKGDMRKLPFKDEFDVALNLFTSFGYFKKESDHLQVLRSIYDALKPKGKLIIDINNALVLINGLVGKCVVRDSGTLLNIGHVHLSSGLVLDVREEFDLKNMRWDAHTTWIEDGETKSYDANVQLFTFTEIANLLELAGFTILDSWGSYSGDVIGFNAPRMIILARRD